MNYFCPACQRHLNGALACAGCGTPAEQLVAAVPRAPAPGPEPQPALAEVFADSLVVLTAPHEGRAGTRKRAASRRRRGRTALAVGLGLVLATGGSIAVARIVGDDEGVNRADQVVLTDSGPKQPDALPSEAPAAPSALPKAAGAPSKSARPSESPSGSPSGPSGSPSASAGTPSQKGSAGGGAVKTATPAKPTQTASATAQPPTAKPKPTPKPKPTKDDCWLFCW